MGRWLPELTNLINELDGLNFTRHLGATFELTPLDEDNLYYHQLTIKVYEVGCLVVYCRMLDATTQEQLAEARMLWANTRRQDIVAGYENTKQTIAELEAKLNSSQKSSQNVSN